MIVPHRAKTFKCDDRAIARGTAIPHSATSGTLPPDQIQELSTHGGILAKLAE
jgi:hypothetical protein